MKMTTRKFCDTSYTITWLIILALVAYYGHDLVIEHFATIYDQVTE